jgi:putative flippase GtrA
MELIETFFRPSRELGELHGVRLAPSFARLVDLLGEIDNDKTYGTMARLGSLLTRLVRSAGAGAIATLADLGSLSFLVAVVGVSPRGASVPALVVGAVVMFFGQKYLAFRARRGDTTREVVLFALVQIGGLALSAILYDLVMRASPAAARHYIAARMVTTNVVWFAYSFPLWHLVFKPKADPPSPG